MAEYYIAPKSSFDATADAIREKTGSQATIEWTEDGFADAIDAIPSGGGGAVWTRPSDWPDISAMDYTSEVVYMTYAADVNAGFCDFSFRTSTGQYSVEVGEIVNGAFVANDTYTLSSNTNCQHYFGSALGGYKVLRVKALTGTLVGFSFYKSEAFTDNGIQRWGLAQGLLEFWAKLGTLTYNDGFFRGGATLVQNIHLGNVKLPANSSRLLDGCRSLKQIDAESWDTSSVENMSYMFQSCGLSSANIEDWDTSALKNISDMFTSSAFESLDLNKWDVSRCTTFHYLFEYCYYLRELKIDEWDTSSVTSFRETFYNAHRLANVDVSKWDTSSATDMQSTFYALFSLRNLDLSGWDFTTVTNTTTFMRGNSLLSSITFPDTLKVISANAFIECRNLFEWHFKSTTPPTLDNTNAFANMTDGGGKKIYVPYSADHSVLNAYQTETNWSTYASYIYEEATP